MYFDQAFITVAIPFMNCPYKLLQINSVIICASDFIEDFIRN